MFSTSKPHISVNSQPISSNLESNESPDLSLSIDAIIEPFKHLFDPSNCASKLPRELHFSIKLKKDCSPPRGCPIYSIDNKKSLVLIEYIKEKLALGHISKSKSSVVSPVMLVPKGLKELRVCIDY